MAASQACRLLHHGKRHVPTSLFGHQQLLRSQICCSQICFTPCASVDAKRSLEAATRSRLSRYIAFLMFVFGIKSARANQANARGQNRLPANGPMQFHFGTEQKLIAAIEKELEFHSSDTAQRVIQAVDNFCWNKHWMMLVGDVKGASVDAALTNRISTVSAAHTLHDRDVLAHRTKFIALELGTYVGYSALRLARLLPDEAILYSCDPQPDSQEIAKHLVALGGVTPRVNFILADAQSAIKQLSQQGVRLDFVFIDHAKDDYLPALLLLEGLNMLNGGAVIVADNVDVFQITDYLNHVRNSQLYHSHHIDSTLEYTGTYPDGTPIIYDGLEVSTFYMKTEL